MVRERNVIRLGDINNMQTQFGWEITAPEIANDMVIVYARTTRDAANIFGIECPQIERFDIRMMADNE